MEGILLFLYAWLGGKILDKITARFAPKELRKRFTKHSYINFKKLKDESTKINKRTTTEGLYQKGVLHWNKEGDKDKNRRKAIKIWHEAEEEGDIDAQYILGFLYSAGKPPIELDKKKGFCFCEKAAKRGHPKAQFDLAFFYSIGRGVKKNYKMAISWWLKLAKIGNADAQWNVGYLYLTGGKGVKKNIKEAECWNKKAAMQGHAQAQSHLGAMYEYQEEIKDIPQAYALYRLSVEAGETIAQRNLKLLEAKMTPQESQKGQADYEGWQMMIKARKDFDAS